MAAQKKDWKEYLLWGLALLVAGGAGVYIYQEEKKKRVATRTPAPLPTGTPHYQPSSPPPPPPPPPATLPFGQGGQPVLYTEPPTSDFDAMMAQANTAQVRAFTVNTVSTPLRAHTEANLDAPVAGTFARGSQVAGVGEPAVTSADGRHWFHVMGQDAATGAPLLGWVDSSYLLSVGG